MSQQTLLNQMPQEPSQNFQVLRDEALAIIARLSGEGLNGQNSGPWTDHNLHDPGITFLEAACFAINDLGYRLDFPMSDLLAQPEGEKPVQLFWNRQEALSCQPLTVNDYRRVILDLPGVRNVQLSLDSGNKSLWDIQVIPEAGAPADLESQVRACFMRHRNLGEDLDRLTILEEAPLAVRLSLTLDDGADTAETLAELLATLAEYIAPRVDFVSYEHLIGKGFTPSDLTTGPWLNQGYITEEALEQPALHSRLYMSRLVSRALLQAGVKSVEKLQVTDVDWPDANDWESWIYSPVPRTAPVLDLEKTLKYTQVVKEGIEVNVPVERIVARFAELRKKPASPGRKLNLQTPGRYRNLSDYLPFQYDLPAIYGVGRDGVSAGETPERVASVRQLQAYLMLFEQSMANQFSQLDFARHLLSLPDQDIIRPLIGLMEKMQASLPLRDTEISGFWRLMSNLPASHRSQTLSGLQQLPVILGEHQSDYHSSDFQYMTEASFSTSQLDRVNRALEHLLARYHEQVPDQSMLKYEELFRHYVDRLLDHPEAMPGFTQNLLGKQLAQLKSLLDRAVFLLDIPSVGGHRSQAGNYLSEGVRDTDSIAGLRHRIYRRLGLPQVAMNALATHNGEGFHLIEGVLLRHGKSDTGQSVQSSGHEVFIVVPQWPSRFSDPDFAQLFVDTLHQELPLHLTPRLIWLERRAMADFERIHNAWLNAMSVLPVSHSDQYDQFRMKRIESLAWYLDQYLQLSLQRASDQSPAPDISDWKIGQLTIGEYEDENRPVEWFTVGYERTPELSYDPEEQSVSGRIGEVKINPDPPETGQEAEDPFVVRIRTPYQTKND